MTEIQKTKSQKLSEYSNKFYSSKWSIITFVGAIGIFALLQIILFATGIIKISGFSVDESKAWVSWVYMAISLPGAALSLFGYVLTIRVDKRFIYPTFISGFMTIITSLTGGMVWTALSMFILQFINIYRVVLINKNGSNYEVNNKLVYYLAIGLFLSFATLGIIFINVDALSVIWWNTKTISGGVRYLDVITSSLVLLGGFLILGKSKYGFMVFMLCNILFIILFIFSKQWLSILQISIFLVSNLLAIFAWNNK